MEFLCITGLVLACIDALPQPLSKPQDKKSMDWAPLFKTSVLRVHGR